MTLQEIEHALDNGQLFVKLYTPAALCGQGHASKAWQCRRNGATKRWKRDPARFRIPIKFGLRGHDAIEPHNVSEFIIAYDRVTAETLLRLRVA
jgi:hypothetical protein